MIAACPKCSARYRVDESKIGAEGVRLRCAKCEAVFRVRAPGEASTQAAPPAAASPTPQVAPEPPSPAAAPAPTAAQPGLQTNAPAPAAPPAGAEHESMDRERLVLVADPDVERGKATVGALSSWGLQTILVHDGVEAMLTIQRTLPRAVILDAALPKMYGFQICEVIKRNESLRDTAAVLVGAINDQDRYRRPPADLYGADVYLEQPDLPDGLRETLQRFGLQIDTGGEASSPPPQAPPVAPPEPAAPSAAASVPVDDALAEGRLQAERLARIVVSDIVLYHPQKFEEAVRAGNVVEALDQGIAEGRALFQQRIDERVRAEKDHIVEELLRVARERGMQ